MNDIYITAKLSIDYIKVKIGMPSYVDEGLVRLKITCYERTGNEVDL